MTFTDSEEYREWVAHETFADIRKRVFITSPEINSLMDEMTRFANSALDETAYEQEEPIIERPYSITNILRKK